MSLLSNTPDANVCIVGVANVLAKECFPSTLGVGKSRVVLRSEQVHLYPFFQSPIEIKQYTRGIRLLIPSRQSTDGSKFSILTTKNLVSESGSRG